MRIIKVINEWLDMAFKLGDTILCPKGIKVLANKKDYSGDEVDPDDFPALFKTHEILKKPQDVLLYDLVLETRIKISLHFGYMQLGGKKQFKEIKLSECVALPMGEYKKMRNVGDKAIRLITEIASAYGFKTI